MTRRAGTVRAAYRVNGGSWVAAADHVRGAGGSARQVLRRAPVRRTPGLPQGRDGSSSPSFDSFGIVRGRRGDRCRPARRAVPAGCGGCGELHRLARPGLDCRTPAGSARPPRWRGRLDDQEIAGTEDDVLYRTYRGNVGNVAQAQRVLSYDLPAKGVTKVDLRLHFAERAAGNNAVGQATVRHRRRGQDLRSSFDIFAAAGALNTATVLAINNVTVTGGSLDLALKATADYPAIAAIEVLCQGTCPAVDTTAPARRPAWPARSPETASHSTGPTHGDRPAGLQRLPVAAPRRHLHQDQQHSAGRRRATSTRRRAAGRGVLPSAVAIDSSDNVSAPSATVVGHPAVAAADPDQHRWAAQTVSGTTWSACAALTACSGWVSGGNRLQRGRHHHRPCRRARTTPSSSPSGPAARPRGASAPSGSRFR